MSQTLPISEITPSSTRSVEAIARSLAEVSRQGAEIARRLRELHPDDRELTALVSDLVAASDLAAVELGRAGSQEQFGDLIDALTPVRRVPSQAVVEQARRNAEARTAFLDEFAALNSAELADLVGSRAANRAALAHGWQKQGRIFAVPVGREQRYPLFQIDLGSGKPKPAVARALEALRAAGLDGWQVALWFTGGLARLGDRRPVDLLDAEPERVVAAAAAVAELPE